MASTSAPVRRYVSSVRLAISCATAAGRLIHPRAYGAAGLEIAEAKRGGQVNPHWRATKACAARKVMADFEQLGLLDAAPARWIYRARGPLAERPEAGAAAGRLRLTAAASAGPDSSARRRRAGDACRNRRRTRRGRCCPRAGTVGVDARQGERDRLCRRRLPSSAQHRAARRPASTRMRLSVSVTVLVACDVQQAGDGAVQRRRRPGGRRCPTCPASPGRTRPPRVGPIDWSVCDAAPGSGCRRSPPGQVERPGRWPSGAWAERRERVRAGGAGCPCGT